MAVGTTLGVVKKVLRRQGRRLMERARQVLASGDLSFDQTGAALRDVKRAWQKKDQHPILADAVWSEEEG